MFERCDLPARAKCVIIRDVRFEKFLVRFGFGFFRGAIRNRTEVSKRTENSVRLFSFVLLAASMSNKKTVCISSGKNRSPKKKRSHLHNQRLRTQSGFFESFGFSPEPNRIFPNFRFSFRFGYRTEPKFRNFAHLYQQPSTILSRRSTLGASCFWCCAFLH